MRDNLRKSKCELVMMRELQRKSSVELEQMKARLPRAEFELERTTQQQCSDKADNKPAPSNRQPLHTQESEYKEG